MASNSEKSLESRVVIKKIEQLSLDLMQVILNDEMPVIPLTPTKQPFIASSGTPSELKFGNRKSVQRFGQILKVIATVHSMLIKDVYCTKRDLYYQNPALYRNQRHVDNIVDSLSSMFAVPRWQLHIVATSKGVLAGDLIFADQDGQIVDCSKHAGGVLLPSLMHKITLLRTRAKFVLVVEKDATFQHLIEDKFASRVAPCIMITAKGYPDLNTRMMVNKLCSKFPDLPFFALVDSDPHGVSIYHTYKHGSQVHSHDSGNLAVPKLQWLGILPSEMNKLRLDDQDRLSLTTRDRTHLQTICHRVDIESGDKRELLTMLEMDKKCELQALDRLGRTYLSDVYLPYKLRQSLRL